jgi:hypothetical protein
VLVAGIVGQIAHVLGLADQVLSSTAERDESQQQKR